MILWLGKVCLHTFLQVINSHGIDDKPVLSTVRKDLNYMCYLSTDKILEINIYIFYQQISN